MINVGRGDVNSVEKGSAGGKQLVMINIDLWVDSEDPFANVEQKRPRFCTLGGFLLLSSSRPRWPSANVGK